ncbi:MAG: Hpt domain-containing protein, partial [Promethearchaeota archaeon]
MLDDIRNMRTILFNEVKEILSNINISLIALEREQTDQNVMKEIIRHVHTLKGLFAATEFEDLTQLCHIAEDAMTELVKLGFVDSDTLTILFSFLNKLEEIFSLVDKKFDEFAKTQDEEFDFSSLMKKVTASLEIDFSILTN